VTLLLARINVGPEISKSRKCSVQMFFFFLTKNLAVYLIIATRHWDGPRALNNDVKKFKHARVHGGSSRDSLISTGKRGT
jgi:hypothetical protein